MDRAGWHVAKDLAIPANLTPLFLPHERAPGDDLAGTADHERWVRAGVPASGSCRRLAMTGRDAALVAAFEHGMAGDQLAGFVDPDLIGERMHLEDTPAGGVGHAVIVAADADHALMSTAERRCIAAAA